LNYRVESAVKNRHFFLWESLFCAERSLAKPNFRAFDLKRSAVRFSVAAWGELAKKKQVMLRSLLWGI